MEPNGVAIKEVTGFVDDLKEAVEKRIRISADFDKICICGMGASAIGGDIIKDMVANRSAVPIFVIKFADMPHWVNKRTLVIVCSYSGNTRETLSMYDQAMSKKCRVIVITAGGKLMDKCQADGNFMIRIKPGLQPRNALGFILGYTANVVEAVGAADCRTEIKQLIPQMRKLRDSIGFKNPDSYAKKIAERIHGASPVIYSAVGISASATRWKQQINENSKMMAFCGSIPEFNHNEITGWSEVKMRFNCVPLMLCEENASPMMNAMMCTSIDTLTATGAEPVKVLIKGKTATEKILGAVMIGDHVSLYLAFMKNVDPIEVRHITSFKDKVTELLNRRKSK